MKISAKPRFPRRMPRPKRQIGAVDSIREFFHTLMRLFGRWFQHAHALLPTSPWMLTSVYAHGVSRQW